MVEPVYANLSDVEWIALTNWYEKTYGQRLPQRINSSNLRTTDPIYQSFVTAGKPGYIAPKGSVDWYTQQLKPSWGQKGFAQQYQSTMTGEANIIGQITTPGTPTTPVTPTIPAEDVWIGYVPGQVTKNVTKNKYYSWDRSVEITEADAVHLRAVYDASAISPVDWQEKASAESLAWEKEKYNLGKIEAQHQMELQFEQDRNRLIQGLPSDDWIRRYTLQNQPNPYTPKELSGMEQIQQGLDQQIARVQSIKDELATATSAMIEAQNKLDETREKGGDTKTAWDELGRTQAKVNEVNESLADAEANRVTIHGTWKTMNDEKRDWTTVPQPYPNVPGWLPTYAPGQVSGRMITAQNVPTPSGQQLTQMPASQAGQLGAYADWTRQMGGGRDWRDALAEAALMQTGTPRGAGGFRTRPATQWV